MQKESEYFRLFFTLNTGFRIYLGEYQKGTQYWVLPQIMNTA